MFYYSCFWVPLYVFVSVVSSHHDLVNKEYNTIIVLTWVCVTEVHLVLMFSRFPFLVTPVSSTTGSSRVIINMAEQVTIIEIPISCFW